MLSLSEQPSTALYVVLFLVLVVVVVSATGTAEARLPSSIPRIGQNDNEIFAERRATWRSIKHVHQWLDEGYHKYAKKGVSYIIPDFAGRSEVLVPVSKVRWLLDQPESVASVDAAHYDLLHSKYNFTDPYIPHTNYHEHVFKKSSIRNLSALIPEVWDELQLALEAALGTSTTQWKDLPVTESMMTIIARASNRMFVGQPLCQEMNYGKVMGRFANSVIFAMMALQFVPKWLEPLIAPIVTIPNRYYYAQSAKYTLPLITERIANIRRKLADPDVDFDIPNDYVTWHIKLAIAENRQKDCDPVIISRYLLPLNFAAIHTTVFAITNTIFDLAASDPSKHYLEEMREEALRVYLSSNREWSKSSLSRLHRIDSALREALRLTPLGTRGLLRKVVSPTGLHNADEGWTVPRDTWVSTDLWSVQHDPNIYPAPDEYDAFRFSRPIEDAERRRARGEVVGEAEGLRLKQMGLVSTGETFLTFGHGSHACPGRFFVTHELKMLLAYMLIHYEIQPLPTRPPSTWFGANIIPPTNASIKVRRREKTGLE